MKCASLGYIEHLAHEPHNKFHSTFFHLLQKPDTNPVRGGAPGAQIGNEHRRGAQSVYGVELQKIVAQLEIVADLDGREIHPLFEAGFRGHRHAARLDGSGFRGVQSCRGPGDQLLFVEHRHDGDLVGIMNSAIQRIIRIKDVAVANTRIFFVILQNKFEDDGLNDGMKIRAAGTIDQIALGGEDRDHRIAGDAEITARRAHENLHRLIQYVIRDLDADLVLSRPDILCALQLELRCRRWFQPLQFLS